MLIFDNLHSSHSTIVDMNIVLALFIVLPVVAVRSQVPRPCVAPEAMETRIIKIHPSSRFRVLAKMSYDFHNRRVRVVDEIIHYDKKEFMDVLYLHNVGKEYRLDLKTKKCEVRAISQNRFYPIGIPENATFYGEANIGTKGFPGEGVLVQSWAKPNVGKEYRFNLKTKVCKVHQISREFTPIGIPPNATFYGEASIGSVGEPGEGVTVEAWGGHTEMGCYHGIWTLTGCLPVQEGYYSNRTGFIGTEFFDITLGISDPNVFIPPVECTT